MENGYSVLDPYKNSTKTYYRLKELEDVKLNDLNDFKELIKRKILEIASDRTTRKSLFEKREVPIGKRYQISN